MTAAATTKDAEVIETSIANVPPPQHALVVPFDAIRMRISPAEARRRRDEFLAFVQECLDGPVIDPETGEVRREGTDYGQMPGTDKKMLYKPGAERICQQFGLSWRIAWRDQVKDWAHGFFYFEAEVTIVDRESGVPICNGLGSCNSREDKYAWRWEWADRCHGEGIDTKGLKSRRRGKKNDLQYRVPNDDPYSLVNTIQKMAIKRAFVGAVTAATASSGVFSSDLDTFSKETLAVLLGDEDEVRTWSKGTAADKRGDLLAGLEQRLVDAKTDQECRAVGVTMAELLRIGQLSKGDADILRDKIAARRAEPSIAATAGKKPEPKADAKPAADAPKAPTPQPEQKPAEPPPAPKSEPKAAQPPPNKRDWAACGKENDGCKCTRPEGHEGTHFDERTSAEWGAS